MKKYSIISLTVLVALILSSCSMHLGLGKILNSGSKSPTKANQAAGSASTGKGKDTVTITSAGYQSNDLQIKVGTTVVWENTDSVPHTVTSDTAGVFDSGKIYPNNKFKFKFKQAGTFVYHSTGETGFTGTIVVN